MTGGGSQLKHINQLFEYITGMDSRIGYPNEHLSSNTNINVTSPLFATGVVLLLKDLNNLTCSSPDKRKLVPEHIHKKNKGTFLKRLRLSLTIK